MSALGEKSEDEEWGCSQLVLKLQERVAFQEVPERTAACVSELPTEGGWEGEGTTVHLDCTTLLITSGTSVGHSSWNQPFMMSLKALVSHWCLHPQILVLCFNAYLQLPFSKRDNEYNWGPLNETASFSCCFHDELFFGSCELVTPSPLKSPFFTAWVCVDLKARVDFFFLPVQCVGKCWPPAWKQTRSPRGAARGRCCPKHKLIARPSLMMHAATDWSFQFYFMGQLDVIREMLFFFSPECMITFFIANESQLLFKSS